MLDYVNAVACLVLLGYCLPVAGAISIRQNCGASVLLILVAAAVSIQAVGSLTSSLPAAGWGSTLLNSAAAVSISVWRKEIWSFLRARFGAHEISSVHPLRRVSDHGPRTLSQGEALRVLGRGYE